MPRAIGVLVRVQVCSFMLLALAAIPLASNAQQQNNHSDHQLRLQRRLERQQRFLREHSDPSGRARADLWRQGIADTKRMKIVAGVPRNPLSAGPSLRRAPTPLLGSSPVLGVQWTQIGPAPLVIDAESNFQGAGPDSGEVVDIAIDPRNTTDKTVYIATNDGGIWKTTDGGTTWQQKTDFMPSLSMGAVTLDPNNASVVYAGTGNPFDGGGVFSKGVGVYKSIDGGDTWTILNPTTVTKPKGIFTGVNINRISVLTNGVILVASTSGVFKSVDGGLTFGSNSPSFNNGSPVLSGFISDMKVDTATATTVYAARSGVGIFQSTDSGSTFPTNLFTAANGAPTTNFGFISLAQSTKPDNQTIYASVQDTTVYPNPPGPPPGAPFKGVYKSTDGGANWVQFAAANAGNGCQCGYDQQIGVDPQDANVVYLGFQNFWLSTDGAANFNQKGGNDVHDDIHAFTFSPPSHTTGGTTTIYVGSDGGIARTPDQGGSWANLNGASGKPGIATNLLESIDIGRNSTANNVYTFGGMQDTGIAQRSPGDAGTDWHLHQDGDGGRTVVDPENPSNAYSQDDGIFDVSTNAGSSWNLATSAGSGLPDCGGNFKGFACAFPVAVDPNNSKIVYAASGTKLFQSTDQGSTFTAIHDFTPNSVNVGNMVPIDSNTMWVGLNNRSVQYSNNLNAGTGSTWNTTTATGAVAGGISGIAIDPNNTAEAVVVYTGFCGFGCAAGNPTKHVFMTANNGTTWSDISGANGGAENLPDLPVHSVVIDPGTTPHTVIVSNDAAVLRSADGGSTWQVLGVGLPAVDSLSLALDSTASPSLLRIGTYGRSAFELTPASGPLLAINGNLAFGTVCVGDTATLTLQLFNVGSTNLIISSINFVAGSSPDFSISGPQTPVTIQPGEEIDFTVQFKPSAANLGLDETATIQINSNDPFQPTRLVPVSGSVGAPEIKVTGDADFGDVCAGTLAEKTIQVCDFPTKGACSLNVTSAALNAGCTDFTLINNPFPATVSDNSCLGLTVRFTPTSAGSKSCTLTIKSNGGADVIVPVTGNTPAISIDIPPDLPFPPTVIQSVGACTTAKPFPISNKGTCNLNITNVTLAGTNGSDYSFSGLPSLPSPLQPGHTLGDGNLKTVFAPGALGRNRDGTLTVTYESDPVAHATTSVTRNVCGEGVKTGVRLLVTAGGVPLTTVKKVHLVRLTTGKTVDTTQNAPLQSVTPTVAACAPFQFQREYGTVSNPIQLVTGSYRLTVTVVLNGKTLSKSVSFNVDTCDFNPNIVVDF